MTYKIVLYPEKISFTVEKGQTVLDAALNSDIHFPNRCQVGACAMCMCKILEGQVSYHLEPMLTEKEQLQGWIFACQAFAESNLVLTFAD